MPYIRKLLPMLWEKSGGICVLCDKPLDPKAIHIDHIVPRARGGTNDVSNLQAVHKSCNSRKHTLTLEDAVARIRTTPVGHRQIQPFVHLILEPELLQRIDDFRFSFRLASRSSAIRWLIMAALDQNPIPEPDWEQHIRRKPTKQSD